MSTVLSLGPPVAYATAAPMRHWQAAPVPLTTTLPPGAGALPPAAAAASAGGLRAAPAPAVLVAPPRVAGAAARSTTPPAPHAAVAAAGGLDGTQPPQAGAVSPAVRLSSLQRPLAAPAAAVPAATVRGQVAQVAPEVEALWRSQQEVETLRRSLAEQEDASRWMRGELDAARQEAEAARADADAAREEAEDARREALAARGEVARLSDALEVERTARERAEADSASSAAIATAAISRQMAAPRMQAPRGPSPNRAASPGDWAGSPGGRPPAPRSGGGGGASARQRSPGSARARAGARAASARSAPGGEVSARPRGGADDIDERLNEFLERNLCRLYFQRRNRGWYTVCRMDEHEGLALSERSAELSIVNGKLMVRIEQTTHDPGWNNGKWGPIERFVVSFLG